MIKAGTRGAFLRDSSARWYFIPEDLIVVFRQWNRDVEDTVEGTDENAFGAYAIPGYPGFHIVEWTLDSPPR
jgi:hypothetical protein